MSQWMADSGRQGSRGSFGGGILLLLGTCLLVTSLAACSRDDSPPSGPTVAVSSSTSTPPMTSTPTTAATAPPVSPARVTQMEGSVSSGDPSRVAAVVALPTGVELTPAAVAALKALGPIHLDESTFTLTSENTATMSVTVEGKNWIAHLIYRDGDWWLAATEPR